MPRWLPRVLARLRSLAARGRVVFTEKARAELEELGLSREDVAQILRLLTASDDPARLQSGPLEEWLYVFRPAVAGLRLYVKVALRHGCVVISCHEDQAEAHEGKDRDG
jgi:hypothetical protein